MVFLDEQVVCLEEVKEETYNKVLLDVHDVVMEMWSGIATEIAMDTVEPYDAFPVHVVLEEVYMLHGSLDQEIHVCIYVVVDDHEII